jgi:predicted nucleic acid-binding protein
LFLLDTSVVSEMRRQRPHGGLLAWLGLVDEADLCLSAVTFGEVQAGVEKTRRQDTVKAAEVEEWTDLAMVSFRILPMGAEAFRLWAKLMHGRSDTLRTDGMIAATALVNGLVVATRNVRDFEGFGVEVVNPFLVKRQRN